MNNLADKMDKETREQLMRKLGHQQYLILLAIATIDNMNTLKSYAALKHAEAQEMATRLDGTPQTPTDADDDEALRTAHLQASFATVTGTLNQLRDEMADADTIPSAPIPQPDLKREIEEFAAEVMEGLTLFTVKKQWWLH